MKETQAEPETSAVIKQNLQTGECSSKESERVHDSGKLIFVGVVPSFRVRFLE